MKPAIFAVPLALPTSAQVGGRHEAKKSKVPGGEFAEDQLVGSANQAVWSLRTRFATSRAYLQVLPEQVSLEQWVTIRNAKEDQPTKTRFKTELSTGLGSRCEFDFYFEAQSLGEDNAAKPAQNGIRSFNLSMRHAFWDWGTVFANPTLHVEYPWLTTPRITQRLIFSDSIGSGWHRASNLVYPREMSAGADDRHEEMQATFGILRVVTDRKFSLRREAQFVKETMRDSVPDDNTRNQLYVGPSLQFRFGKGTMLDFARLWGITSDSCAFDIWLVYKRDVK